MTPVRAKWPRGARIAATAWLVFSACTGEQASDAREARRKADAQERLFVTGEEPATGEDPGSPAKPVFTHLTVRARGLTTELAREPDGTWKVTAPVSARAEAAVVESILDTLASSRFSATVKEAPTDADLDGYGLKPPRFTVTARAYLPDARGKGAEDPARQRTVTLHGGRENTYDGSVYVRRDEAPTVHAAAGTVRWALDRDTFALRAKDLLAPLDERALKGIDVKAGQRAYQLARDADGKGWRLQSPVAAQADAARVEALVKALVEQRALSFPEDSPEARKRLGLETPSVDARFTGGPGGPVRIRMSRVTADGVARAYALREQGPRAVLGEVTEDALAVLDVGVRELKDRRVLDFRRQDVRRIVFHPGGGAPAITVVNTSDAKEGAGSWEMESPRQGKAQHFKLASLLRALDGLKATGFGEARPRSWARYGVTEQSRGAALLGADGKELARLWLGDEVPDEPGTRYARGSGTDVVKVPDSRLTLPTRPEDLLEAAPARPTPDSTSTRP
ncbi:DUF4340 domain-containing protein [Corallococcus macrosporus]|uniref:DUF4340 domain-containing protein n=1 Tax=Corallococcus macrosporus DSM 14697 TaxID=1189310 RepID=A0A250JZG5_9BACT|nr:DUF4340 domain-containing protein [Corallococcus macrosporus]ATB49133.1 hypothetical protein MYMAC_004772 [Corallococcus macrosporus DSM 14697]